METTNPTNQEVLVRASCFLEEKQPKLGSEECQHLVRELNAIQESMEPVAIFVEFTTRGFGDF